MGWDSPQCEAQTGATAKLKNVGQIGGIHPPEKWQQYFPSGQEKVKKPDFALVNVASCELQSREIKILAPELF